MTDSPDARTIRVLIADDEPLARRGIRQLLGGHPDAVVVGECRDGRETLDALEALRPDLLFLDVQMPELDGFAVLRARGHAPMPVVVFVTAYDEHALRAFDAHALDYLVKPVTQARFADAMRHVRLRLRSADALELTRRLEAVLGGLQQTPDGAPARRLIVPTASGELVLDVAEVDWIRADDYYAAVHARGRRHLIRESLASLESRLDPTRFVRVHRSAIVSVDRIRELRVNGGGEMVVVLRDGTRVPVSRRRREQVGAILRSFAK